MILNSARQMVPQDQVLIPTLSRNRERGPSLKLRLQSSNQSERVSEIVDRLAATGSVRSWSLQMKLSLRERLGSGAWTQRTYGGEKCLAVKHAYELRSDRLTRRRLSDYPVTDPERWRNDRGQFFQHSILIMLRRPKEKAEVCLDAPTQSRKDCIFQSDSSAAPTFCTRELLKCEFVVSFAAFSVSV